MMSVNTNALMRPLFSLTGQSGRTAKRIILPLP